QATGIRGVHLVDEAAPLSSLLELAMLNKCAGLPLYFWGNIRFEKDFTPDVAALLAEGGLVGVSGGIEVASETGFKRIGKGIGLKDVVQACAAFKEAGILTHAYLIYGYWDQDEQEIIDAAELMRQLFAAQLLDSAFWHKFVLTRHSRIYREYQRGKHRELRIIDRNSASSDDLFADNDLSFEGETDFDRFTEPLDRLLAQWMHGNTEFPVFRAIPGSKTRPRIPLDHIEKLIESYIEDKEAEYSTISQGTCAIFVGSRPWIHESNGTTELRWHWKHQEWTLRFSYTPTKPQHTSLPAYCTDDYTMVLETDTQRSPRRAEQLRILIDRCSLHTAALNHQCTVQPLFLAGLPSAEDLFKRLHTEWETSRETTLHVWTFLRTAGLLLIRRPGQPLVESPVR
ncbi:MAG: radical SAM protein, partial [Termitinemataceae bacterium]